ncbi:acetolactate synthase, large subunit [Methanosarcina thermophila]|jgi:acetolactate synthase-1/2/3 large subunit|uniref:Acetolactate synthase, large subunit n=3 Tax=Methanosarcina thermophila TaxID=2210 RepID=A0A1I6Y473_METTE|nr:acetolactate synthase large subunit [Methanosarcina thermophila]ALK05861.1 MAG: acetolactate synthase [Methanosarcina sp. 795]AKB12619.1 acetolactate synthase [Methanosarcina thermophila TM-1]AKB16728.1 acetolactate synthase [Methanosarcina thermophila CHTI-55]NLU57651.1 acetolactate synthase large subunit [Methanosarcina thermophila]SFT45197.1 acetolactate synthase, large subunit [Methanosarcina thermophila]
MKASDLFVAQLKEEGVEYIFGLPGEENLDLLESLRTSGIKLIVTRHEQAAAFMAATYGRLTGKPGVCFSTLGPGATNLVTGVAQAQLIGAPLISISGQKALIDNWQARFQLVNVVRMMEPLCKNAVSITDPGMIPTVIRNAFKHAEAERPGAVHIELPEDVAGAETEAVVQKRSEIKIPHPDPEAVKKAAAMICEAKNPLIIVSSGANRKAVSEELEDFVQRTGIYLVHTQMGKGVVPDDCPQSLFATGIHARDYVNCGIDIADLIITIGYDIVEYPPYLWNRALDKQIINIDFVESVPDRYFNPTVEIIGDIAFSIRELAACIPGRREFPVFEQTKSFIEEKINTVARKSYPPLPQAVVQSVRKVLGRKDIITLDNGIYKLWFARLYKTYAPNTVLLDNALATMGAGLPSGIAAKLLNPERRVLAICGDGGFMMNCQELETAVRYGIPVVVLILNDNGFGFIKWKQKKLNFTDYGLDYGNPDFPSFARSFGAEGFKVREDDDLEEVLERAFALNKVAVIECPIDYSVNYETFSIELGKLTCKF